MVLECLLFQIHWLYSPVYRILQRHYDDWFIIFTSQTLGQLNSIHIWHDSYGNSPAWYCKRIDVICVRDNKIWCFHVNRWFSIFISAENVESHITVGKRPRRLRTLRDTAIISLSNEFFLSFRYIIEILVRIIV